MRTRRTELSGWQDPENESCESATDRPPANALEAAAARAVRVGKLRRALAAGTYRPDAGKVAQALLKSLTRLALFGDDH